MTNEKSRTEFGPWRVDHERGMIVFGETGYEVWQESAVTAEQKLDWLYHLKGKVWGTPDVLASLLDAFSAFDPAIHGKDRQKWHCDPRLARAEMCPACRERMRAHGRDYMRKYNAQRHAEAL